MRSPAGPAASSCWNAELHRAAAAWHEEHGLADDAIRHALAAGEMNEAGRLIERHFDAAYMTGERTTIDRWLSAVPASVAASRPRLRLARTFAAGFEPSVGEAGGLLDPLTAREREVLSLLAAGAPNQGIADQLVVTLDTVKKHVTHVLAKLGAANRTEAVARARQLGLLG
jgi:ATP/maltotriose-dependent transcriptional regulator MalT